MMELKEENVALTAKLNSLAAVARHSELVVAKGQSWPVIGLPQFTFSCQLLPYMVAVVLC